LLPIPPCIWATHFIAKPLRKEPGMLVQNAEISAMFGQAAELLEIQGENQFRVRAYRRAARAVCRILQRTPQEGCAVFRS
jgi:hypothetical protein